METIYAKLAVFLIWPVAIVSGLIDHPLRAIEYAFFPSAPTADESSDVSTSQIGSNCSIFSDSVSDLSSQVLKDILKNDCEKNNQLAAGAISEAERNASQILHKVKQSLDNGAGSQGNPAFVLCATYDRTSKLWLDWIVLILGICTTIFLTVCYIVFRRAVSNAGRAKKRLRQLTITTFLLLGAFNIW